MDCPRCGETMDYDEVGKNDQVLWFCNNEDCQFEATGTRVACDAEYFTDSPSAVPCDWYETFDKPNGGYNGEPTASDIRDQKGCDEYHRRKDEGEL